MTPNATFYTSMAESLPLQDNSVDLALSTTSFHHWQDQAAGIREIARVLRPGGYFMLVDISLPEWLGGVSRLNRFHSPYSNANALRPGGITCPDAAKTRLAQMACYCWKEIRRQSDYLGNLCAERARALAASSARSFGGAFVSSELRRVLVVAAISSTAARNAASLAFDGLLKPLTLRTNCNEAARISSSVAGGSKLKRLLMFLHICVTSIVRVTWRLNAALTCFAVHNTVQLHLKESFLSAIDLRCAGFAMPANRGFPLPKTIRVN